MKARRSGGWLGVVCGVALSALSAQAVTYNFENVTANNIANVAAGEAQLSVEVLAGPGANQATFVFHNVGSAAMSITDVYFDDGTLLSIASISSSAGVSFSQGATPASLPGGNTINFNTSAGGAFFSADSDSPIQPNGVNPGETLTIIFDLKNGQDVDDVIAAIELAMANPGVDVVGGLRIGIHVQGFANGGSESFVTGHVPDAGSTIALLGLALSAFGLGVRRMKA